MSSPQSGAPARMRANRTVVESKCLTCQQGFTFGEEVCVCSVCGGFHHAACWNLAPLCQHNAAGAAAATAGSAIPSPPAPPAPPPAAPAEAQQGPASDEQFCMQCGKIIKKDALKCRHCGYVLNAQLAQQQDYWPGKAAEINKAANSALWCGIIGLFICGPILGTIAIIQANKAIREIDMAPQYSSSKGKATAGRVMGIIAWVFFVIFLIVRLSNIR